MSPIETQVASRPRRTEEALADLTARVDALEQLVDPAQARPSQDGPRRDFTDLVQSWERETQFSSSPAEIAMHPAYQRIIGMGTAAIPLILAELEQQPGHWFWALKAISGDDPAPESARGKLPEMTRLWLEWGRRHGYAR